MVAVWSLLAGSVIATPALAQQLPENGAGGWRIVLDGESATRVELGEGSLDDAVRQSLAALAVEGYPHARVDSVVTAADVATVFVSRGSRVIVADLRLEGVHLFDADELAAGFATRVGAPLNQDVLAQDVRDLLGHYERSGYLLARATVEQLELTSAGYAVAVRVEEGVAPVLRGIELTPAGRTDAAFAVRLAGLSLGQPLTAFRAAHIRRQLEASGLFETIGEPSLIVDGQGGVVIHVPVEEAQPGAVDLVLGYLPPAGPGGAGQLVGSGSLVLRNLFGRGRRVYLELVRNPGFVSSLEARVGDPFLLGLPLRLEATFSGHQQDTTYARHRLAGELAYRIAPGLEAMGVVSREFVESGIAGAADVNGRPRVPEADAWFAGLGIGYSHIDRPLNPRRGLAVSMLVEQGTKHRTLPAELAEPVAVRQQRFSTVGRLFVPTFPRHVLAAGVEASVLIGDVYDESDLFRLGGATSLRGYDEGHFRGNVVGRALLEYRYQLDPTSFAFVFADLGYVRRPETAGVPADERVLPGYGIGLQYRTPLGLASASYALNPDEGPTRGRIHVGLSLGL